MSIPTPKPGLVIRYSFLWSSEHEAGAAEGKKDRPCAIVVAVPQGDSGQVRTVVAPITHAAPNDPSTSLEVPANVCRSLGLDVGRHWIRFDELNRTTACYHAAFLKSCAMGLSRRRKLGGRRSYRGMFDFGNE